ncbi:MAG TPA: hypothetical protein VN207_06460 [Ktedonobacteraceae bacterium]|nr:hypothetical protein [Ktedonobacteraceae bacterium]
MKKGVYDPKGDIGVITEPSIFDNNEEKEGEWKRKETFFVSIFPWSCFILI